MGLGHEVQLIPRSEYLSYGLGYRGIHQPKLYDDHRRLNLFAKNIRPKCLVHLPMFHGFRLIPRIQR